MMLLKYIKIRSYETGLVFRDREFKGLLTTGTHWLLDLLSKTRVEIVSQRAPWLVHEQLDMIVKSSALAGRAVALDLKDHERGLVRIDGRFSHVLAPGLYAYWVGQKEVRVEIVDALQVRFDHKDLSVIVRSPAAKLLLDICNVERDRVGVVHRRPLRRYAAAGSVRLVEGTG
jgi:hypothetical protein